MSDRGLNNNQFNKQTCKSNNNLIKKLDVKRFENINLITRNSILKVRN